MAGFRKKDIGFGQSSKWKVVCLAKMHHISKNWERIFDFQYKVVIGQCAAYEVQNMGKEAFENASFENTPYPNGVTVTSGLSLEATVSHKIGQIFV